MSFRITGLLSQPFHHLFGLSDQELAEHGARRFVANCKPGFPDRIEMRDAEIGESLILANFVHQPADSPYRSSHAVFVLEGAEATYDRVNEVPEVLRLRQLSVRAFDEQGMMVDADLAQGRELEEPILRLLANPRVAYLHVHYAKPGCFAARIDRA